MPDNVSLTAQEINTLKSVQTNALTRLNIKNFCFNSAASNKLNARTFPIIGNNTNGIRVYAGSQQITINSGDQTAQEAKFDMSTLSFINSPVITATVSSDNVGIKSAGLTVSVQTDSNNINQVSVWVKPSSSYTSGITVDVNLIAIGYA